MASFLSLYRFTSKGVEHIKESPARVEAIKRLAKSLGVEVKQWCLLMGDYDSVFIFDAPDDETATRFNLAVCSQGNVHSHTLRAFSEEEFRKMVAKL